MTDFSTSLARGAQATLSLVTLALLAFALIWTPRYTAMDYAEQALLTAALVVALEVALRVWVRWGDTRPEGGRVARGVGE